MPNLFATFGFSLNATFNNTSILEFVSGYLYSLPTLSLQGDVAAISISFMLFFLAIVIINKITAVLLSIIKKTIFLFITSIAFYYFLTSFSYRVSVTGLTTGNIIFGAFGILMGLIGFCVSFYWLFKELRESINKNYLKKEQKLPTAADISKNTTEKSEQTKLNFFTNVSSNLIKQEKNILTIIIYQTVAQFGVFSTPTMVAPNSYVGFVFFLIFLVAAIFFIKKTYNDFSTGLKHFGAALLYGFILSIILGFFWGRHPLNVLFSFEYFATASLVALITGIAVSLFMSSK